MRNPSAAGSSSVSAARKGGKTTACCSKVGLKKGPWTPEEDEILSNYINREGEGRWRTLPKRAGLLRCGKSCRLRWMNYLRPCVKRGRIAPDEEDLILRLHRLLGNRWSLIAGRIPGRTDNEIKNYWNTHLSKKLISQGIDPRTHKPLDPQSANQFQLKLASSSSKPVNRKPSLSSNPNHENYVYQVFNDHSVTKKSNRSSSSNSGVQETVGGDNNGVINPDCLGYTSALLNFGDEMGVVRSTDDVDVRGVIDGGDEDMNCCSADDVFSSFLNSLINEEPFTAQQQQAINGILPNSDPFVSIATSGWDSSLVSSTFNPIDHLLRFAKTFALLQF